MRRIAAKYIRRPLAMIVALLVALLASVSVNIAHSQQQEPVIYEGQFGQFTERRPASSHFATIEARQTSFRQQAMRALSASYRVLAIESGAARKGEPHSSTSHTAARGIAEIASALDELFAIKSPAAELENGALPSIWNDRKKFDGMVGAFADQAALLREAVASNSSFDNELNKTRYYCVACHETFRRR